MLLDRNRFANRDDLARALSSAVSASLSRIVSEQGAACLAVSGGSTPGLFFDYLSHRDMAWEKVTITLVDERQVDEASPRSNARLVKINLLKDRAAAARFVGLYGNTAAAAKLCPDVVVLGMGEDGHTASFFPGGDQLVRALDPTGTCAIISIEAQAAGEPRLTFTLPKLLAAKRLFLHIEGKKKMDILNEALAGEDVLAMPIRAVLRAARPLSLYWCP